MAKIIGNTTATPNPRPDWNQMDDTKADFVKNKPAVNAGEGKDSVVINNTSNQVVTTNSVAGGLNSAAGSKCSYFNYIDFTNHAIFLSDTQPDFSVTYVFNDDAALLTW